MQEYEEITAEEIVEEYTEGNFEVQDDINEIEEDA